MLEITSHSLEQTVRLGMQLGILLSDGDIVCLSGDLGSGKTALACGIGKGWGALESVNSPTFVFVHEHHRQRDPQRLYHLDCYRLNSDADAISIGLEDILAGPDVVVIEWPERVESFLHAERLWIILETIDDNSRRLTFEAVGARYAALLDALRKVPDDAPRH